MKKQLNPAPVELTNEQAIDAIYAMFETEREPLAIQTVGHYGFINPGPKDIPNLLAKLDRKTRNRVDALRHAEMADVLDSHYNQREDELFDLLSDWSRFAIIIPDYASAPAVVAHFLAEFGGKVDFHTKPDYEAIHQHTTYKDVNLEFQFHTKEYAELKKATDVFYHNYNNVNIEKNSKIEEDYLAQREKLNEYCQMVYSRSDFRQNLLAVQTMVDDYEQRTLVKHPKKHDKLAHFCMYARKAEMVQKELADYLPQFLQQLIQMEKTELTHEQ